MASSISIVIPTYRRGGILLETLHCLLKLTPAADEIIVVDQTERHHSSEELQLQELHNKGAIRWLKRDQPSIPAAMNLGLLAARSHIVLFLDDDILPNGALIEAHRQAQAQSPGLVAGQVLQPGQTRIVLRPGDNFRFNSANAASIDHFIGCNFSVLRDLALDLGGFDENFIGAAFCYESEFSHRYKKNNGSVFFCPSASIDHLAISTGGTRSCGYHYRTTSSSHAVGAYYYLMRCRPRCWLLLVMWRPLRSIRTRFHIRHPWWIPLTLIAESRGFIKALQLCAHGPRLISARILPRSS